MPWEKKSCLDSLCFPASPLVLLSLSLGPSLTKDNPLPNNKQMELHC